MKVEDIKVGMKIAFPTESHGWTNHNQLKKEVEISKYSLQYLEVTGLPDEDGDVEVQFVPEGIVAEDTFLQANLINIVDLIPYTE